MSKKKSPTGCRSDQLFGLWFIAPEALDAYREQAMAMDLDALAKMNTEAEAKENAPADPKAEPPKPYLLEDGVAIINISGPTTKYPTSFSRVLGGTSTMMVERALAQAHADGDVKSILMHFDSAPGGTVAGAFELFDRIYSLKGKGKQIWAHGSDQMTSAAVLFASACDSITANRNAIVGSIGVRAQLVDSSEKLKRDGIKVIPIASGKYKAAGTEGTPITADQVKDYQRQIDAMNDQFVADVVRGRAGKLTEERVKAMEARCYVGGEALDKKLIDGIASFDDVLSAMQNANTAIGISGIPNVILKHAAPERKLQMELLSQLRELFGAAEMSEEQAIARVRSLKTAAADDTSKANKAQVEIDRLTKENGELAAFRPKPIDPEALRDRADLCIGRIDVAVAKQELPPVLATKLKGMVAAKDGKPNPFWLTTAKDIDARPIDAIMGLFAGEKLGGPAAGSQTSVQSGNVLHRDVLGQQTKEDTSIEDGKKQAATYQTEQLASRGLK